MLRKFVKNNAVSLVFVLPNLAINAIIQLVLDVHFGWSGYLSVLAWLIGGGVSFEFGVVLSMLIKSNFTVAGRKWSYAEDKNPQPAS